jgi:hypothetical protein
MVAFVVNRQPVVTAMLLQKLLECFHEQWP